LAVLLTLCPLGSQEAADRVGDQRAPLSLVVDGVTKLQDAIVILRGDDVLVLEDDLRAADVPLLGAAFVEVGGARYVSLASLAPQTTFKVDSSALEVDLQVDPTLLGHAAIPIGVAPTRVLAKADPSGFLSYSITSDSSDASRDVNGFVQAGVGSAATGLLTASAAYSGGSTHRGLIAYTRENETNLSALTIGDEFAQTGELGGDVVVGGVGATRHFEFQPNYTYFPTPGLRGEALSPTTADLYVNGTFVRAVQLAPGTFDLSGIPVGPGGGVTQIVLHDAYGNTETVNGAYYQTRQLLRQGVTDYDYHVGFLRPDPFDKIDQYGALAALGEYRIGLSDHLTVGGRFEHTAGISSGGPQIDVALPLGHVSFDAAASDAFGTVGRAFAVGYDYFSRSFGVSFSAETLSANYATASLEAGQPRQRSSLHESFGMPIFKNATIQLSNTTTTYTNEPPTAQLLADVIVRPRRLDAYVTFSAERDTGSSILGLGVPIGVTHSVGPNAQWTFGAQITFTTGKSSAATAGVSDAGGAVAESVTVSKPAPIGPGFGYQIAGTDGTDRSAAAQVLYQTPYGNVETLSSSGFGPSSTTVTVSGALVGFRQGVFFTQPVNGGYALVDVPGFPHLPVFLNSQFAGRTDGHDETIVSNLSPYYDNQVAIDELRNRLDLTEDTTVQDVRPKNSSGVFTEFTIRHFHAYSGHIVIHRGGKAIVPVLGQAVFTLAKHEYTSDLGREGQFYVEDLEAGTYAVTVATEDGGTCAFHVAFAADASPVTDLGTLTCEAGS
jgi:outer membrane usher protein